MSTTVDKPQKCSDTFWGEIAPCEHLVQMFCQSKAFSLFCAYPKSGFTQDTDASIREICAAHSKVIAE